MQPCGGRPSACSTCDKKHEVRTLLQLICCTVWCPYIRLVDRFCARRNVYTCTWCTMWLQWNGNLSYMHVIMYCKLNQLKSPLPLYVAFRVHKGLSFATHDGSGMGTSKEAWRISHTDTHMMSMWMGGDCANRSSKECYICHCSL